MRKRIKPGYKCDLPGGGEVFERNGQVCFGSMMEWGPERTVALAKALADAVEEMPRELWEVARDIYLDFGGELVDTDWQDVVNAVLAAHNAKVAERSVVMFAVQRADGQYRSRDAGFTADLSLAWLFRHEDDGALQHVEAAGPRARIIPVYMTPDGSCTAKAR